MTTNDLGRDREWIDADKLRDVINEQLSSYPHGTAGHHVAEEIACKLEALFPDPQPPTTTETDKEKDMTTNPDLDQARKWPVGTVDKMNEWVESRLGFPLEPWQMDWLRQMEASLPDRLFGAWATHPKYGEGVVISHYADKHGYVRFVFPNDDLFDGTSYRWVNHSTLTFHTPDMSKNEAEIDTSTEHVDPIDTTPDHPEFLETEEDYRMARAVTITLPRLAPEEWTTAGSFRVIPEPPWQGDALEVDELDNDGVYFILAREDCEPLALALLAHARRLA